MSAENASAPGEGAQADTTGAEGNAPEQVNHTPSAARKQGVNCPGCGGVAEPDGGGWFCPQCEAWFDSAELAHGKNGRRPPRERVDTDSLKARVALSAIFEAHGVALDGAGMGRCPWHADDTPSLHVNDDAGYFKCHGCDAKGDHLSAIQRFDGSDFKTALAELQRTAGDVQIQPAPRTPKPERPLPRFPVPDSASSALNEKLAHGKVKDGAEWVFIHEKYGPAVAGWRWHDRDGNWIFSTARHERDSGKAVLPYYFGEDGKWHLGDALSEGRPIFRLHELIASDLPVLVVEGEKCASVEVPGFIVTTWRGGTGAVAQTDFSPLEGRDVTIWPDADEPGITAAQKIRDRLPHARILRIDGKPKAWDISDAVAEGIDPAAFIRDCPILEHEPPEGGTDEHSESPEEETKDPASLVKDYGHASVLAPFFLGKYRWAHHRKAWMRDTGILWEPIPDELFSKKASDTLRKEYTGRLRSATTQQDVNHLTGLLREICTYTRIQGALSFLKGWPGIHTNPAEWDRDLWALNVRNGVIDLHTGELREHRSEDLMTRVAPVDFDPTAKAPRWAEHLDYFLPDPEIRRQVQRTLGLSLVGVTMEEALDIWYGTGGNGKTTTSRVVMSMLGDYAKRAAPNLLVASKYERHPTEIADLAGVRLVISIEIDEAKKLAEALVKELTGGDTKKARFMRCDFFEFSQTFSIILLVNHEPVITGTDDGIWRRIRLIPWNETIPSAKKRPQEDVVDDLKAEGPAILNWLLEGLRDWHDNRAWTSEKVRAATQKYREAQDFLGPFLGAKCEREKRYKVSVADLYAAYETWCVEAGEEPVSKKEIGQMLRNHGFFTKREGDENVHTWQGLRLRVRLNTTYDSVSTPTKSKLAGDMESRVVSSRNPSETPVLDFNSQPMDAPQPLPEDLSGCTVQDLKDRALALSSYIDGSPPHAERMPDLERLTTEIAAREGGVP